MQQKHVSPGGICVCTGGLCCVGDASEALLGSCPSPLAATPSHLPLFVPLGRVLPTRGAPRALLAPRVLGPTGAVGNREHPGQRRARECHQLPFVEKQTRRTENPSITLGHGQAGEPGLACGARRAFPAASASPVTRWVGTHRRPVRQASSWLQPTAEQIEARRGSVACQAAQLGQRSPTRVSQLPKHWLPQTADSISEMRKRYTVSAPIIITTLGSWSQSPGAAGTHVLPFHSPVPRRPAQSHREGHGQGSVRVPVWSHTSPCNVWAS